VHFEKWLREEQWKTLGEANPNRLPLKCFKTGHIKFFQRASLSIFFPVPILILMASIYPAENKRKAPLAECPFHTAVFPYNPRVFYGFGAK